MPLLKLSKGQLAPALEEPLTEVSFEEWRENPQALADAAALVIPNDASIADIAEDLSGFSAIILEFPKFKDGRAYSQARLLRERLGYAGELRARGEVLRDQVLFMARCGFNAFEFHANYFEGVEEALREFSFVYQPAADGAEPVWQKRLETAAAA